MDCDLFQKQVLVFTVFHKDMALILALIFLSKNTSDELIEVSKHLITFSPMTIPNFRDNQIDWNKLCA